jgi:hypothetical protein
MKTKKIIEEKMKKHEKVKADSEKPEIWTQFDGVVKDAATPVLKLKASALAGSGKLHIQFGCPDVEGLHSDMEEELGTPYIFLADNSLRPYGVAFNMMVGSGSIDEAKLMGLGSDIMEKSTNLSASMASDDKTYAVMSFAGIVEGEDNKGEPTMLMDFRVGEADNRLLIGFSNVDSNLKNPAMNYPEMRVEWFLAWLVSRYYADEFDLTSTEEE